MAFLIPAGGFAGDAEHLVTGDTTHPRGLFTRAWVRSLIGVASDAEIAAYPIRGESGQPDGYVFAQKPAAAHDAGRRANLRAGSLCGMLLFGPAVHCTAADPIEWKPGV